MTFKDVFCDGVTPSLLPVRQCYTFIQAKREMQTLFYERFLNGLATGLPGEDPPVLPIQFVRVRDNQDYTPKIQWYDVEKISLKDNGEHWLRFSAQNYYTRQASFMGGKAENIGKKDTTTGMVTVQLFLSRSSYETLKCDALKTIVRNCFVQANTPGGLWFRNSNISEYGADKDFFRTNVTAEYKYDSVVF